MLTNCALSSPLGFAELASSDTMLCAEELAPIELDAGPIALAGNVDEAPIPAKASPPQPAARPSVPLSGAPSTSASPEQEDDIYSATPVERLESQSLLLRDLPAQNIVSPTNQATARQAMPTTPRFSFTSISPPIRTGDVEAATPNEMIRPETRQAPLPSPGRPDALRPHCPPSNRVRSEATDNPPWTPTIKFIQSGELQESQVAVSPRASPGLREEGKGALSPRVSPGLLALQQPTQLNKVSEWLHRQSFVEASSDLSNNMIQVQTSSGVLPPAAVEALRQQVHSQVPTSQGLPPPKPSMVATKPVAQSKQSSVLLSGRTSPSSGTVNKIDNGPDDRVVESIIEVPSTSRVGGSRGVQLKDLVPGHARKIAMKGQEERQRKKRFSWEDESGSSDGKMSEDTTPALDSRPKTPTKSTTLGQISPRPDNVAIQHSPRASPVPSPSLLMGGHLSPSHAQKGVLVEHADLEPCTASLETATLESSEDEIISPLPLAKKKRPVEDLVIQKPNSNAFDQISELIAVANAAMPSARRLTTAIGPIFPPVDGWHSPDKSTSQSAPGSPDQLTARPFPPPSTHQHLTVRPAHKRSVSTQDASISGLKPPVRQHNRSQSLAAPFDSSPSSSVPRRKPLPPNATAVVTPKRAQAVETDGHKSHHRASVHLTLAGSFPYHPLRSSPVLAPESNAEVDNDAPPSWDLDPQLTPKPIMGSTPPATKSTQRTPLQLKVPSYPGLPSSPRPQASPRFQGLPSSPRPSPRFQPKLINNAAVDTLNEQQKASKSTAIEEPRRPVPGMEAADIAVVVDPSDDEPQACMVDTSEDRAFDTTGRRPSESTVSSPTSSIFSSLRDSSVSAMSAVSASSSLVDSYYSPLADLTAEMVALEKSQAQLVRQHRRTASKPQNISMEQMPIKPAHMLALTSPPLVNSPTISYSPRKGSPQPSRAGTPPQRPKNISEWIRPAGMPASPVIVAPEVQKQEVAAAPVRPSIPTVVIRAPTVRLRAPPRASLGRRSSLVRPPPSVTETPFTVSEQVVIVEDKAANLAEKPTLVADVVKMTSPTVTALPVVEGVDLPSTPNDLLLGSPESMIFDHLASTEHSQPMGVTPIASALPPVIIAASTPCPLDTPPLTESMDSSDSVLPTPAPTETSLPATVMPVPIETAPVADMLVVIDTVDAPDPIGASAVAEPLPSPKSLLPTPPLSKVSPPVTVTSPSVEMALVIETPPVIKIVDMPESVATSSTTDSMGSPRTDFEKSLTTKAALSMDAAQEEAASPGPRSILQSIRNSEDSASSRPQSFLDTIRNSWRTSTFNLPRPNLTATAFQNSHIRAKSQSNIPEPQGIMAEALAAAKRQQAEYKTEAIAAWHQSGQDKDHWPARESVTVIEDSISNVGAAIRFFNASFSSLRPKSETDMEPVELPEHAGSPKLDSPSKFAGTDIMSNAVTVTRKRGPPVVVRIPAMQT